MSETSAASGPHNDLHVRFPAASFVSMAEFEMYCQQHRELLEARYAHEGRIAAAARPILVREGTCAPCLQVTRYTSHIEPGESRPNWREGQTCDCGDAMGNRPRATLHFLESVAGLAAWSRVLLFGPPNSLDRRLAVGRPDLTRQTRLNDQHRLDAPDGGHHVVVSSDHLHQVPQLTQALAEIRRVLAPGGSLVFTVPFRYRSAQTVSHPQDTRLTAVDHEVHEIGWDMLDRLREVGFLRSLVHMYWSEELGYLGAFNMIFSAHI